MVAELNACRTATTDPMAMGTQSTREFKGEEPKCLTYAGVEGATVNEGAALEGASAHRKKLLA